MRALRLLAAFAIFGSLACGAATPQGNLSPHTRRICDGSDTIRLAYKVGGGGTIEPYTIAIVELGWQFLYVDGHCHYWVRRPDLGDGNVDPSDQLAPFREGVLTPDQEESLHAATWYDDFAHAAPKCPERPGLFDASSELLWDGAAIHGCYGGFNFGQGWPLQSELWAAGTPMAGALRFEVGQNTVSDDQPRYAWPLASPLETYETPPERASDPGQTKLVTEPADLAALRDLRARAKAELNPMGVHSNPAVIALQPKGWVLVVRDDLPFTRPTDGLWDPPPPAP
ncbi:MAG: hypothetical protein JWM82_500 [Myxococcales bacterium]|nr:hypothetical protein [Myxococcales bacterium]